MMNTVLSFSKYHGTGNDFIIINGFHKNLPDLDNERIRKICHRHFGVGADGLIIIKNSSSSDFEMVYFNSDGLEGTMCGNGGRAAVAFALHEGIIKKQQQTQFMASDGIHRAEILSHTPDSALVKLEMHNTQMPNELMPGKYFINTGSPHLVVPVEDPMNTDVFFEGRKLRYSNELQPEGANINFIAGKDFTILVRTYERGVENETLSCGTGVTASAIVWAWLKRMNGNTEIQVNSIGGVLSVSFNISQNSISDIILSGPAQFVFSGTYHLKNSIS
jgi:diaminopimelate epimerase